VVESLGKWRKECDLRWERTKKGLLLTIATATLKAATTAKRSDHKWIAFFHTTQTGHFLRIMKNCFIQSNLIFFKLYKFFFFNKKPLLK